MSARMVVLPSKIVDALTRREKRAPRLMGTTHTTRWLLPRELRRCTSPSCREHIAFRDVCRACGAPTESLWT